MKSRISILIVAIIIAKNNEDKYTKIFNILIIQETNISINYLALELTKELQRYNIKATIIRLGSLLTKNTKFNTKILKPHFINNFYDNDKETEIQIASYYLYNIAKSTNNSYKASDKRFALSIKNLTLYKAIQRKVYIEHELNLYYTALLEKLEFIQNNLANDIVNQPYIYTLQKKLLQDTLASIDIVVTISG